MSLKKVRKLNYERPVGLAPPAVDAVIQTDQIVLVEAIETRRNEPCVRVHLNTGATLDCLGVPGDFAEG